MNALWRIIGLVLMCIFFLIGCRDPFAFSPFEASVQESMRNTTALNLRKLESADTLLSNNTFHVALISDSHYHYNDLAEALEDINQNHKFSFIIVTGDITENGLLKEYELFHSIMSHANIPYLTVIGNHDHLSNGEKIYQQMYGANNYSFTFQQVKFVAWDNTIWESKRDADYDWLDSALSKDSETTLNGKYHHVIPLSHIPPFDGQLINNKDKFHNMLLTNGISVSVHGHKHEFFCGELMGDGIQYMTVGSPQKRSYASLTVTPDTIYISKINF